MIPHSCSHCRLRAKHDRDPRSWLGRLWRWHIGFCPGWRSYIQSLPADARAEIERKYGLHHA